VRYTIGLFFCAIGAWLLTTGLAQRSRVLASRARRPAPAEGQAPESSLFVLGEITRPLILFALAYAGLKSVVAYILLDAGRVLSPFDLGAFLFLLAAYGTWFVFKTRFPEIPAVAAGASASLEEDRSIELDRASGAHRGDSRLRGRHRLGHLGTRVAQKDEAA